MANLSTFLAKFEWVDNNIDGFYKCMKDDAYNTKKFFLYSVEPNIVSLVIMKRIRQLNQTAFF